MTIRPDALPSLQVPLASGLSLRVVDVGAGEAVLLLHVLGSSLEEWALAIPTLAEKFRCVAPDLPGFGASDAPPRFYSIRDYATRMFELLDARGIERAHVIGHSMGAVVAADMAVLHPERLGRLVLCSPPGADPESRALATGKLLARVRDDGVPRLETIEEASLLTVCASAGFIHLANLNLERARAFLPSLAALAGYPYETRGSLIRTPTLLVWGRHDRLVPVEEASTWQRWIPGSHVQVLEEAGHSLVFEAPDAFHETILNFLGRPPGR